jgi:circadian clock protein KaiC
MKSRGMKHSNEVREFIISSKGLDLVDVYRGTEGVLIGAARKAKQKQEGVRGGQNGNGQYKARIKK